MTAPTASAAPPPRRVPRFGIWLATLFGLATLAFAIVILVALFGPPNNPAERLFLRSSTAAPTSSTKPTGTDTEAFARAQSAVRARLKAPATAKFCRFTEALVREESPGKWIVGGWVDSLLMRSDLSRGTPFLSIVPRTRQARDTAAS